MGKKSVNNPHDQFFKILFSDPEKVEAYLKGALPDEISQKIDYSSLKAGNNSYVDEQLQNFYADVVYQCRYGEQIPIQIAFLFEHKSYVSRYPHFQLLRYMLNIWEKRVKAKQPILPVIPMIIYHGKRRWKLKTMKEYFGEDIPKELHSFIPDFQYLLTNLQDEREDIIREKYESLSLQMGFLLMKSIREEELLDKIDDILKGITVISEEEKWSRIYTTTFFIFVSWDFEKKINCYANRI